MNLRPWSSKPEHCGFACILDVSEPASLQEFLHTWVHSAGTLDLPAAWMPASRSGERRLVVWPHSVPPDVLLYWLERRDWQVFWRHRAGDISDSLHAHPFFAYGYDVASPNETAKRGYAYWPDGRTLELPSTPENLFDLISSDSLSFLTPGINRERPRAPLVSASPGHLLQIELVEHFDDAQTVNLQYELSRLRKRMRELGNQIEVLEWQAADATPPVELRVYRETEMDEMGAGTHWALRRWFVSAPEDDIASFLHARVAVQGLADCQALHLVSFRNTVTPPPVAVPPAAYMLHLDVDWRRRGRWVYVPRGWQLRPAPPHKHERLAELLERALWANQDPSNLTLLFLPAREGGEHSRLAVSKERFAPLRDHIDELNFAVAANPKLCEPAASTVERILHSNREELEQKLQTHIAQMRGLLDNIWAGEQADMAAQRNQLAAGIRIAAEIRQKLGSLQQTRDQVAKLSSQHWKTWTEFVDLVLAKDREMFPERTGLAAHDRERSRVGALLKEDR